MYKRALRVPRGFLRSDEETDKTLVDTESAGSAVVDTTPEKQAAKPMSRLLHLFRRSLVIFIESCVLRVAYQLSMCMNGIHFLGAMNASVWESLKTMLWPLLLWWLAATLWDRANTSHNLRAATASAYSTIVVMLGLHALVKDIGHAYSQGIDIALSVPSIVIGQSLGIFHEPITAFLARQQRLLIAIMLLALLVCLCLFTLIIPAVPFLFQDWRTGEYGKPTRGCPGLDLEAMFRTVDLRAITLNATLEAILLNTTV